MGRIEALVSGTVQMVSYRDFATRSAQELGIRGTVYNQSNGTVRIIAEGAAEALDRYIERLKEGPPHARVAEVSVTRLPATGEFPDFCIVYG